MDLCACGHRNDQHIEHRILLVLGACKMCRCRAFEWAGTTNLNWNPSDDEDWSEGWSPEKDRDEGDVVH